MAFFDKLNDLAKNIGEKTSEAIETGKLNNKINAARNAAGEHMKKIGELYYGKYAAGEAVDPAILEYCAAIDAQNQLAAEAQAEIGRIKAENEAAKAPEPMASATPMAAACGAAAMACPSCGTPKSIEGTNSVNA